MITKEEARRWFEAAECFDDFDKADRFLACVRWVLGSDYVWKTVASQLERKDWFRRGRAYCIYFEYGSFDDAWRREGAK